MSNFEKNLNNMISRILKEEIEIKSKNNLKTILEGGEWTEIEVDEELKGGQNKLDANKNGKIDAKDFEMLRNKKKQKKSEMDEFFYGNEEELGDYEGDEEAEDEAEELSAQEPTYVGKGLEDNKIKANLTNNLVGSFSEDDKMSDFDRKMKKAYYGNKLFGSFTDEHGWFDEKDQPFKRDFDFDYDEEEFSDFDSLMSKYGKKQRWFAPERSDAKKHGMVGDGRRMFDLYKEKTGKPFRVRIPKISEQETEEGNAFTGALADAKEKGDETFKVGDKTFNVKEGAEKKCPKCGMKDCKCNHKKETKEKWEDDVEVKKTGQYSDMSIEELNSAIKKLKAQNDKLKEQDKPVPEKNKTKMSQLYFAKRAKQGWKGKGKAAVKESLQLTEDELIDMIEKIVYEQKVKDVSEKNNITSKKAEGLKKTEKVLNADKKENDDYAKQVVKKMKEYIKPGSAKEFNESPENFPESNYTLGKKKEEIMKYHPSDAVDEYIESFAFPGQTNITFDEIKPDKKRIEKYLKGDSTTGNAVKDKDGKALGNVAPSEVGERFMKNFEDNLYGAEQKNVSYNKAEQPVVDVAGSGKLKGTMKKKTTSTDKASKIMNQLESTENKTEKLISEEMEKMKKLIKYNEKTQ